jgi:hypothetical protein
MRAPLSLSLSGWWHATTTTTTGENENEREREKIENCVQYILCLFARVKKIFPNRFFLPLIRFQNAPRAMRSNNNNNDTNRREKERERERERPLFPFHAIVKMRF